MWAAARWLRICQLLLVFRQLLVQHHVALGCTQLLIARAEVACRPPREHSLLLGWECALEGGEEVAVRLQRHRITPLQLDYTVAQQERPTLVVSVGVLVRPSRGDDIARAAGPLDDKLRERLRPQTLARQSGDGR